MERRTKENYYVASMNWHREDLNTAKPRRSVDIGLSPYAVDNTAFVMERQCLGSGARQNIEVVEFRQLRVSWRKR